MWKEEEGAFKALSRHQPEGTEKMHENLGENSRYAGRLEPRIARIRSSSDKRSAAMFRGHGQKF
jgi:hypothetical protein